MHPSPTPVRGDKETRSGMTSDGIAVTVTAHSWAELADDDSQSSGLSPFDLVALASASLSVSLALTSLPESVSSSALSVFCNSSLTS
jgi:hypothetical protein